MAKKCSKKNPCRRPRANWWKKTLGVDWFDTSDNEIENQLATDPPESQGLTTDDGQELTVD